jgi:hypothetical protein
MYIINIQIKPVALPRYPSSVTIGLVALFYGHGKFR